MKLLRERERARESWPKDTLFVKYHKRLFHEYLTVHLSFQTMQLNVFYITHHQADFEIQNKYVRLLAVEANIPIETVSHENGLAGFCHNLNSYYERKQ